MYGVDHMMRERMAGKTPTAILKEGGGEYILSIYIKYVYR